MDWFGEGLILTDWLSVVKKYQKIYKHRLVSLRFIHND